MERFGYNAETARHNADDYLKGGNQQRGNYRQKRNALFFFNSFGFSFAH
jgi:hypothetical protein